MKMVVRIFFLSLVITNAGFAHEKVATCSIESGGEAEEVVVEKYPGGLPSGQIHFTTLKTIDTMIYQFAELFDGTGQVAIYSGKINPDKSVSFANWKYGQLPIHFLSNRVEITCR
jgi:hypothetical protein